MSKIAVIGHSHINTLVKSYKSLLTSGQVVEEMRFISARGNEKNQKNNTKETINELRNYVNQELKTIKPSKAVLCFNGNEHNILGFFHDESMPYTEKSTKLSKTVLGNYEKLLPYIKSALPKATVLLIPPPPIESEERIREFPGSFSEIFHHTNIEAPELRLNLWKQQCDTLRSIAHKYGLTVVEPPLSVFSSTGFLAEDCLGEDPTHGNLEYGLRVLPVVLDALSNLPTPEESSAVRKHPYTDLPDHCFWKQSISLIDVSDVDPTTSTPFKIHPKQKVATAGSCFAQHISKRLREAGFNFFVTEQAEDSDEARARGFYDFSARYGNVYTARQLLQLFDRAFGYYTPIERVWPKHGGGFCDPFRPRIEPEGFPTEEAVIRDSRRHLAAVRRMFRQLDIFVFTLGLTECWVSRLDGAAYPVAPGVVGSEYDTDRHGFVNFSAADVTSDLKAFLEKLKLVNPKAKVIFTVSPVPLVATAVDRHVLVSTTYSKAVLRVAAEEVANEYSNVSYFPSYEIITGQHAGNSYYEADRRGVTEQGVDHVMRIFMASMTESANQQKPSDERPANTEAERKLAQIEAWANAVCDEEMLQR
ncbi:MAG: GSCFA domain-containing protein [Halothiobacillaceae bacterium]|nr:GSCFA domain-containing protein [Halothiobacillaceae bacterium]